MIRLIAQGNCIGSDRLTAQNPVGNDRLTLKVPVWSNDRLTVKDPVETIGSIRICNVLGKASNLMLVM
jgi:hypothetical protein